MTEDQIRELFREMRDEPPPPDSRVRVRMAVAARRQSWRERMRRHWLLATAVLVPALVVMAMLVWRPAVPATVQPPVAQTTAPTVPAPVVAMEVPVALPPRVIRVRQRVVKRVRPAEAATLIRPPEAATLIRIDTPDPDVVILLIGG